MAVGSFIPYMYSLKYWKIWFFMLSNPAFFDSYLSYEKKKGIKCEMTCVGEAGSLGVAYV